LSADALLYGSYLRTNQSYHVKAELEFTNVSTDIWMIEAHIT
jgi:hypothetical protein